MCQCGRKDGRVTRLRDREGKMGQRREEGRPHNCRKTQKSRIAVLKTVEYSFFEKSLNSRILCRGLKSVEFNFSSIS